MIIRFLFCLFLFAASIRAASLEISNYLAKTEFANASWGVHVEKAGTSEVLFSYNSEKLLKPASNAKLYTGALVLSELGEDYQIKTSFYSKKGPDASGTLHGDLIIYGRGDPSFSARFNNGDYTKSLDPLVNAIREAGIKRITGRLIGEISYFNAPSIPDGWTHDDLQYYYGAEVSALSAEDNVIDLLFTPGSKTGDKTIVESGPRTGYVRFINETVTGASNSPNTLLVKRVGRDIYLRGNLPLEQVHYIDAATVGNPTGMFLELLAKKLKDAGVRVNKESRISNSRFTTNNLVEIAATLSPPMSQVVSMMMKPSQNLYAHMLFLHVGAQSGAGQSDQAALRLLKSFIEKHGISPREVMLDEGSGLSRSALVTPRATVKLLQAMAKQEAFYQSLPLAGLEGTLRNRFKKTEAEGKLRAKTGTLRYVNALSGYCTNAAGVPLVFSIMLNAYMPEKDQPVGREAVEAVALKLITSGAPSN